MSRNGSGALSTCEDPTAPVAMREHARILIVRLGALGDVVNTLPALSALRAALPQAEITWVVEPGAASLLERHPLLNSLTVLPRRKGRGTWRDALSLTSALRRTGPVLRRGAFDVVLDFQGNLRSGLVVRATRAPISVGYARGGCREGNWLFTNRHVRAPLREGHRVDRALALLRGIGLHVDRAPAPVVPHNDERAATMAAFVAEVRAGARRVAAIHPSTSRFGAYKQWPAPRYAELIQRLSAGLGAAAVVTWGPGERDHAEEIVRLAGSGAVAPETRSAVDLAELFRRCDQFIGSDSGPMHLASAVGTPVVALFGPKDPRLYGPYFGRCRIVSVDLPCRPCKRRCCNDPRCMTLITVGQVLAAAAELFAEAAPADTTP